MAVHRISLFIANDGVSGNELWVTDGTAAGTSLFKDINPGLADSNPDELTALGDGRFLFAASGTNGRELWITDGTAAGTSVLKDIRAGSPSSFLITHLPQPDFVWYKS